MLQCPIGNFRSILNNNSDITRRQDTNLHTFHPLHKFYYVEQSGCRYISKRTHTNRYQNTFLPTSVRLQNQGGGNYQGWWGDTLGCSTIISIVTTNVVVLCCVMWIFTIRISSFGGLLKVITIFCMFILLFVVVKKYLFCCVANKNLFIIIYNNR